MASTYGSIVRKASSTLFALAGLALPFPALGQVADGDFEIGFGLGIVRLDDALTDEEDLRAEVRGGWFLSDHFELELQAARLDGGLFNETLDLAYQAAAGLRYFFTPRFAMRVEAALTFDETLEETIRAESATAGLVWRVGR